MIHKSGAGPLPMPGKTITARQLAEAFRFAHEPTTQAAAMKISTAFQQENGCEGALESFHAHLPLTKLRSDLEQSFAACFRVNEYDLQISLPVAQVLLTAGLIHQSDLVRNPTYSWYSLTQNNCLQAFAEGCRKTATKIGEAFHRSKRAMSSGAIGANDDRTQLEQHRVEEPFRECLAFYGVPKELTEEERQNRIDAHNGVKHTLRYGLAFLVMRPTGSDRRHSVAKVSQNQSSSFRQNSKQRSESNGRGKLSTKKKEKTIEERAAAISGFTVEVCQEIITEFKAMKSERQQANRENEKLKHLRLLTNALQRFHNRTDGSNH